MDKTESKAETLNRLFKENGLLREDWFEHTQYKIISRSGIEKIQYKNNVTVRFEAITMTPAFCVVKAQAIKPTTDGLFIEVQTFGSAGFNADGNFPKNKGNQYLYFPEIAEKRALSRAVLKVCGFYQLGVFGEDESEEFKPSAHLPNVKTEPANSTKKSDKIDEAVANYTEPERPLYTAQPVTINQKTQILLLLNNTVITSIEKEKLIAKLNTFDTIRADQAIAKLKKVIFERTQDIQPNEANELASDKQTELLKVLTKTHVLTQPEKDRITEEINSKTMLKTRASKLIELWKKIIEDRKAAEKVSSETTA